MKLLPIFIDIFHSKLSLVSRLFEKVLKCKKTQHWYIHQYFMNYRFLMACQVADSSWIWVFL